MKKIVGVITTIISLILVVLLGYKFVYKVSPREFITKDTRIIYANEGVNNKNFLQLLPFIGEPKDKKSFEKSIDKLKYVSKIYIFSDKEFYEFRKQNAVAIIDAEFSYPFYLAKINNYFTLVKDGIFKLKPEYRDRYLKKIDDDIYMLPFRGLFIVSTRTRLLKEFVGNHKKYMYDKEIENSLDENRDNLLGTLIYNNKGTDFYGIEYITATGVIKNNLLDLEKKIIFSKEKIQKYQSTKSERELLKYLDKGDIYISLDDFSELENLFFNPYVTGINMDIRRFSNIWKELFNIDIEEMLKEIDGEVIIRNRNGKLAGLLKMKEKFPETQKFMDTTVLQKYIFGTDKRIKLDGKNLLVIGYNSFQPEVKTYKLPKGTFLFGEINLSKFYELPDLEVKILGQGNEIKINVEISAETLKEILD